MMLAQQRSPGDWASTGLHGPGEREILKDLLSLVVRAKPFYWDESSIPGRPSCSRSLANDARSCSRGLHACIIFGDGPLVTKIHTILVHARVPILRRFLDEPLLLRHQATIERHYEQHYG